MSCSTLGRTPFDPADWSGFGSYSLPLSDSLSRLRLYDVNLPCFSACQPGILDTTIQIEVYEGLRLTSPAAAAERDFSGLLIAPDTQLQLRTNRDDVGKVRYT